MHRGEVFLYSGSGAISWLIKRITKSQWSHSGWIFKDHRIVEADAGGVESESFPYPLEKCAFLKLKVPDEAIEKCLAYAQGKIGRTYDYKLFFGLFWRWIFGWDRKKKVPGWSGYICSEIIAKPVEEFTGIRFAPDGVHPQNTVPEDIWQYALKNPEKCEITFKGEKVV